MEFAGLAARLLHLGFELLGPMHDPREHGLPVPDLLPQFLDFLAQLEHFAAQLPLLAGQLSRLGDQGQLTQENGWGEALRRCE